MASRRFRPALGIIKFAHARARSYNNTPVKFIDRPWSAKYKGLSLGHFTCKKAAEQAVRIARLEDRAQFKLETSNLTSDTTINAQHDDNGINTHDDNMAQHLHSIYNAGDEKKD